MKLLTYCGTGTSLCDYRRVGRGEYEAAQWVTVFFVPVVPFSAWRIRLRTSEPVNLKLVISATYRFEVVGQVRLSPKRVLRTYALTAMTVAIAGAPFLFLHFPKDRKPTTMETIAIVGALLWVLAIAGFVNHMREKPYDAEDEEGASGKG